MKSFYGIRSLALVLAFWFLNSMEGLHAAHKAFIFSTDGAPIPTVLTDTIKARFGNDTVFQFINPGATSTINGVTVKDMGAVAMPRSDDASAPAGIARQFTFVGDFTLQTGQSIWGWGGLLLKLEILGSGFFEAGSLVNVSAIGKLGGAGGGTGGTLVASPYTQPAYYFLNSVGTGNGLGGSSSQISTNGRNGNQSKFVGDFFLDNTVDESIYPQSLTGGTGTPGQGDRYYLSGGGLSGQANGGVGAPSAGGKAVGGLGGNRGRHASEFVGGIDGENGGNGGPGQNGTPGTNGAAGRLETLAGTARHLRGGSGGGAGATGGWGVAGSCGGQGGGGGAGAGNPNGLGGSGGLGGVFGNGGQAGTGGGGGGGGGGILVLVRGAFVNGAVWEAKGTDGSAGTPGSAGAGGSPGNPGAAGQLAAFGGRGGKGGDGGRGGDGGKGGDGGRGASGSGGNIQIATSLYIDNGATFDTAGGNGAPAGIAQHDHFNEGTANAPFSAFAAEANPYRSYVIPLSVPLPPPPTLPVSHTPMSIWFTGGPASYGIVDQMETMVANAIAKLNPPADCHAVVFRLDGLELFSDFTGYDFLAYVNIRPGTTLANPRVAAISPADTAMIGAPFTDVYQPSPQPLLQNKGYMNDPVYNPAGSGATPVNPTYGQIWFTTIEKGKSFNVSAEWSPYAAPRTIRGTPIRGFVSPLGGQAPQNVLFLTDKGNPDLVIEQISEYSVSSDPIMLETAGDRTVTHYARVGSTPTYRYKMGSSFGNPNTKTGGFAACDYYRANGSVMSGETRSYSNRSNTDPAVTMEVTVPTLGRAFLSEALLSTGIVVPNLDATERVTNVSVKARLVGPTPFAPGLAPTETGPGMTALVDVPGHTNTMFFAMANQDALPLEWSMELYDKPKLTQLSILSAQIVGTGSAAFSLVNSLPTVLDLGSSQQFMVNFTPPALGKYQAVLRLQTDAGAGFGQPGEVYEIQLHGTTGDFQTWAYNLPQGPRGANDDADGNGISNIIEYGLNGGGRGDLPKIISGSPSSQAQFSLPGTMRPDVFWSVEGSKDLGSWQRVANRNPATGLWSSSAPLGAVAEQSVDGKRRVSLAMPSNEPKYFMRLVGDHLSNSYSNDFSTGAGATLRGPAVWDQESLRLSDGSPPGLGAAVMDGVSTWASQTGFQATFQLQMDSGSYEAGNGVAFAVGDLGTGVWGDRGPATARNLTVLVETYYYLAPPPHPRGFEIVVNGITIATDITPAFQSNLPETIQVTYTPATGVSVRYRGTPILTNVAVPGFALQAGDQYGFSAYRGENNHVSRVANVEIQPR